MSFRRISRIIYTRNQSWRRSNFCVNLLEKFNTQNSNLQLVFEFVTQSGFILQQNQNINFIEKLDFPNERKKIASKILENKFSYFETSQLTANNAKSGNIKQSSKIGSKIPETKNQKGRMELFRKSKYTQMPQNLNGNKKREDDLVSVRLDSPKKVHDQQVLRKKHEFGTGVKEKSEYSRSNFHLSVLKSEKCSIETQTKKSGFGNKFDNSFVNIPGKNLTKGFMGGRFGSSENMEEQLKLTVFKNGPGSKLSSLKSRKL